MNSSYSDPTEEVVVPLWQRIPWSPIVFGLLCFIGLLIAWHPAPPTPIQLSDEEWRSRLKDIERILDPMWERLDQRTADDLLAKNNDLGLEEFLRQVGMEKFQAIPDHMAMLVWEELEELGLGDSVWMSTAKKFGIVPARLSPVSLGSYIFLHAGFLHMLLSLVFLVAFGVFFERYWPPGVAALVFVGGGVLGGATHWFLESTSVVPAIGASGAVTAWAAAFLPYLYDNRRIELPPMGQLPGIPVLPLVIAWPVVAFACSYIASGANVTCLSLWGHLMSAFLGVIAGGTMRSSDHERKMVGVHRNLVGTGERPKAAPPKKKDATGPTHLQDDWLSENGGKTQEETTATAASPAKLSIESEARQALESHDWSSAHHWLVQVLEAQPQNVEMLEGMLRTCLALTRDEEAYNAGQRLMVLLIKDGRREKSMVVYDRLFSKFGRHSLDPTSLNSLARFYENAARYERAIELYAQVARSKGPEMLVQKAMLRFGQLCAYRTNDLHRADQALRFMLQSHPSTPLRNEVMDVLEYVKKAKEVPEKKRENLKPGVMADLDES